MFEVGRRYKFTTNDHDGNTTSWGKVQEWAAPLLKIERLGSYEIVNTSSACFVSAEPDDAASKAAIKAAAASIYPTPNFLRGNDEGQQEKPSSD